MERLHNRQHREEWKNREIDFPENNEQDLRFQKRQHF